MKMQGTCRKRGYECQHLLRPMFHSGFTGKSGAETWWQCRLHRKPIRDIRKCGDATAESA